MSNIPTIASARSKRESSMATGARKSPIVPKVLLTVWPVDRSDSDGASTIEAQVIHTPESA